MRGKQKYLGFLIPPKFPQDFTVAHFPSSPHREFPLPQNSCGQRASASSLRSHLPIDAASLRRLSLLPGCCRPSPSSQPLWPEGMSPLAASQTFPTASSPSPFFFAQSLPAWDVQLPLQPLACHSLSQSEDARMRGSVGKAGARGEEEARRPPGVVPTFRGF